MNGATSQKAALNYLGNNNSIYLRSLFMPTKNRTYDPILEDEYDGRCPLYKDEEFQHGIRFKVKVRLNNHILTKTG